MPPFIEDEIARIRDDRERGAAELAEAGLRLIASACRERAGEGSDAILATAADLVRRLAAARPSMAPIGNWAAVFHATLGDSLRAPGAAPAEACDAVLAVLLARKSALSDALVAAARPNLADASGILTLSYSSTVEAVLARAAAPDCLVVVAESRPLMEGRKMCRRLEAAGRRVRCITDAQIGLALGEVDMALIGADAILNDLAVVNKAGSLLVALAAHALGKPCHVAADTYKVDANRAGADAALEERSGAEVWPERPEICANVTFEPVASELIGYYLTEKGPLTATDMQGEVAAWRSVWHAVLADA